jgi:hypothetical protein
MNGMRAYRWRSQRLSQFCRVESESFCLAPPVLEVAAEVQTGRQPTRRMAALTLPPSRAISGSSKIVIPSKDSFGP